MGSLIQSGKAYVIPVGHTPTVVPGLRVANGVKGSQLGLPSEWRRADLCCADKLSAVEGVDVPRFPERQTSPDNGKFRFLEEDFHFVEEKFCMLEVCEYELASGQDDGGG